MSLKQYLSDIKNLILFFKVRKTKKIFFCENQYYYEYLKHYIERNSLREKILIISLQKLNFENQNKNKINIFFKTNFCAELVFLLLAGKYLFTTTPDLNKSFFKKTIVSTTKYFYIQHSQISLHMGYRKDAFDAFDAVQVLNCFQEKEINYIKKLKNLKLKVFRGYYHFLENFNIKSSDTKKHILIAPTWNTNFYKEKLHLKILKLANKLNLDCILRPHPMTLKKKEIDLNELKNIKFKIDIAPLANLTANTILISDWSGIFIEYTLLHKKKCILINTDKKILNSNYQFSQLTPIEIFLRNKFAKTFEIGEIDLITNLILEMSLEKKENKFKIDIKLEDLKKFFFMKY